MCRSILLKFGTLSYYHNVDLSVEKYFTSERSERVKYLQHEERNFVSPSGYVMFYLLY